MKTDNIPTVYPVNTKAVFTAQDVKNSFQAQCDKQWQVNFNNYKKQQIEKVV